MPKHAPQSTRIPGFAGRQTGAAHSLIGVDEVGRGAWAGPLLVVAAQAITILPNGLKDSKLLSKKQRLELLDLLSNCCSFGEGWVSPAEIDTIGLARALGLGGARALKNLSAKFDEQIILDGSYNYLPDKFIYVKNFPKADNLEPIVSAASIYAKVTRDKLMLSLSEEHPGYLFHKHVGYGTKAHREALRLLGVIEGVHRLSFKPVAEWAV